MYFPDLSPCEYYGLSVGWLEKGHDFPRGEVLPGRGNRSRFLERLLERCRNPTIRRGGIHWCEFCPSPKEAQAASIQETSDGDRVSLGSGVIRVNPRRGIAFVAPALIYHYIQAHRYLPPASFIEAVMEDNPENAETVAERNRWGAYHLSRVAFGWLWSMATRDSRNAGPKDEKRNG
jgi:hypothetical protein